MSRPSVMVVVRFPNQETRYGASEVGYGDADADVVYRVTMNGITDPDMAFRHARLAYQRAREGYAPYRAQTAAESPDGFNRESAR